MTSLPTGIEPERLIRAQNRQIRKKQDQLNRFTKLVPGSRRVWELDRIAMELEMEADDRETVGLRIEAEGLREDVLFLRRLQFDLHQLRNTVRGPRGGRMSDVETYYMKERT